MRHQVDLKTLFSFPHLEKSTQQHLRNVYATLSIGLITAAIGVYGFFLLGSLNIAVGLVLPAAAIGSLVSLLSLIFMQYSATNTKTRFGLFLGFALCTGLGLGPLTHAVIDIDPSILPTAFIMTSTIFVCFTLTALLTKETQFLYLGGMLMSGLTCLLGASLVNLFLRSPLLYSFELYAGLIIFCLFVMYDSQLIIYKRRRGDLDFIWHAVDLFIDFVEIFRHLLVILAKNSKKNDK